MRRSSIWSDPRVKPPYGVVDVDWSHSTARGLIGCWLFNEGAGGPTDLISDQKATPVNGNAWATTVAGSGDKLTRASSQYLDAGTTLPAAAGAYTVALRFIFTTLNDFQMIMTRTAGSGTDWEIGQDAGVGHGVYYGFNGGQLLITTTASVAGNLVDATFSIDATTGLTGYINGIAAGTAPATTAWRTGTGSVNFGRRSDGNHLNGTLIHAIVYKRSVSSSEALRLAIEPYTFLRPIIRRRYFVSSTAAAAATSRNVGGFLTLGVGT